CFAQSRLRPVGEPGPATGVSLLVPLEEVATVDLLVRSGTAPVLDPSVQRVLVGAVTLRVRLPDADAPVVLAAHVAVLEAAVRGRLSELGRRDSRRGRVVARRPVIRVVPELAILPADHITVVGAVPRTAAVGVLVTAGKGLPEGRLIDRLHVPVIAVA